MIQILFYIIIFPVLILADTDHLIFSRIVLAPDKAEMVEIINPTNDTVNLENYYLTDATSSSDYYYNIRTGSDFWSGDFRDFIIRFPSYNLGSGDTIIMTSSDGLILGVDRRNGQELWEIVIDGTKLGSPVLANGVLYIPSQNGTLYAVE